MKSTRLILLITVLLLRGGSVSVSAQTAKPPMLTDTLDKHLIQFSGLIVTEERGQMVPVPYANIYVPSRKTGTSANYQGFFSLVVEKGESVHFSALGFRKSTYVIPQSLTEQPLPVSIP